MGSLSLKGSSSRFSRDPGSAYLSALPSCLPTSKSQMIPDIHFPARKAEKAKGKICKNLHAVATYFPIQKKKEMDI